jgi:hypothetical protein
MPSSSHCYLQGACRSLLELIIKHWADLRDYNIGFSMTNKRPQFPMYVKCYTWASFFVITALPIFLVTADAAKMPIPASSWEKSTTWLFLTVCAFLYARHRCSSQQLYYNDGLMYVVYSARVWGAGTSLLLAFPAVLLTFIASLVFAIFNDLRWKPESTPSNFYRLIASIYRNRLNQ